MKFGDTEKSLVLGIIAIAVAVVCVLYFAKPNYEETQSIKAECEQLQLRLNELNQKQAKRDEYLAGIEEFENAFQSQMTHFAPDLNQEVSIMFVQGIKDNNEFKVSSLGLGQPELFYTLGSAGADANIGEAAPAEGEAAPAEGEGGEEAVPAEGETASDIASASGPYECYRADFPISYQGSYESLKDVVAYIDNYEHRMTVNTVSIAYDAGEDVYSGSIDMKCYAITGPDRPATSIELNDVEIGVDNIFTGDGSSSGSSNPAASMTKYDENDGAAIENSYDFYAMINPATSDVSAKVVGQNGAGKDSSVISNADNNVSTLAYEFYEKDGKNYCKYTLDNSTSYEAEVTSAEDVKLLIQSTSRKDDDDKAGVKVTIKNSTSLPVYVKVTGDDSVSPRVEIASKTGAVKVY